MYTKWELGKPNKYKVWGGGDSLSLRLWMEEAEAWRASIQDEDVTKLPTTPNLLTPEFRALMQEVYDVPEAAFREDVRGARQYAQTRLWEALKTIAGATGLAFEGDLLEAIRVQVHRDMKANPIATLNAFIMLIWTTLMKLAPGVDDTEQRYWDLFIQLMGDVGYTEKDISLSRAGMVGELKALVHVKGLRKMLSSFLARDMMTLPVPAHKAAGQLKGAAVDLQFRREGARGAPQHVREHGRQGRQRQGPVTKSSSQIKCLQCGGLGHKKKDCRQAVPTCFGCGKKGHKMADCVAHPRATK